MKKINLVALVALVTFVLTQLSCVQSAPPAPTVDAAPTADVTDPTVTDTPVMPDQQIALWRQMAAARPRDPVLADTRSHEQIAAAACTGPNGQWRCKGARPMAFGAQPIIPVAWTVPQWYLDPNNVSGTASDTNDCVTTSTACRTCQEIEAHRWGTYSPRLRQVTHITALSSQTADQGNADPCYFSPFGENNGGMLIVNGVLNATTQVATGTLGTVTAKNRNTPQTLNAVLPGGVAAGEFIVNSSTVPPSAAWIYKNVSGSTWAISQPLARAAAPVTTVFLAEVDTWAAGNTVTIYSPAALNIAVWSPVQESFDNTFAANNYSTILNLNVFDPESTGNQVNFATNTFYVAESVISRVLTGTSPDDASLGAGYLNVNFAGGASVGIPGPVYNVVGGQVPPTAVSGAFITSNFFFTADFIQGVTTLAGGGMNGGGCGLMELDANTTVGLQYTANIYCTTAGSYNAGQPVIWGTGFLDVSGQSTLLFKNGASQAGTTFKNTGGLRLNSTTTGHSVNTASSVDTPCGGITVNTTNLDAATSATCASSGFGGLAFRYGGASISNQTTR